MPNNKANPVGRPESYSKTDKWSAWIEEWKLLTIDTYEENRLTDVKLPTIESLALFIQDKLSKNNKIQIDYVSLNTIEGYGRGDNPKPEFLCALEWIKREQKKRLLNSGLSGAYNSTIARLVLSTNHGFHEKSENKMEATVKMPSITKDGKKMEFDVGD